MLRKLYLLPVFFQCPLDALLNLLDHWWRAGSTLYDLFEALMIQNTMNRLIIPRVISYWEPKDRGIRKDRYEQGQVLFVPYVWSGVYTPGLRDNVLCVSLCPCQNHSAGLPEFFT